MIEFYCDCSKSNIQQLKFFLIQMLSILTNYLVKLTYFTKKNRDWKFEGEFEQILPSHYRQLFLITNRRDIEIGWYGNYVSDRRTETDELRFLDPILSV